MENNHRQKGFTVLELMMVIFIIGILASIIFVYYNQSHKKARDAVRDSEFSGGGSATVKALDIYYRAKGHYPYSVGSAQNNGVCLEEDSSVLGELKAYLGGDLKDPSYDPSVPFSLEKFCYHYKTDDSGRNYVLWVNYETMPSKEIRTSNPEGEENPLVFVPASLSRWASFKTGFSGAVPTMITIKHLDGAADDSFDLFVNGSLVWHYQDQSSGEDWYTDSIPLNLGVAGEALVKLSATGDQWSGFDPYGQVTIGHIWLSLDDGSVAGQFDPGDTVITDMDVGDPASEADSEFSGWGPVEPDTNGGSYGGIINDPNDKNCRVLWSPNEI